MRYISSAERIGMRRGYERGFQRGFEQSFERGFQKGFQRGVAKTLRWLLESRFGPLPDWVELKLQEATLPQLEQ
jgi:flagellar biosynthesis/type III secretory pathway protein FliH